ncbi:butyrophilin subfamily 1 member A1-like [Bos indicus]|uniref:Butyrophilin subfamily 1 member A1-like n=1 Tax=Bos indicus TaxID=9915 RepID=A0ABM4RDT6_BOSIN
MAHLRAGIILRQGMNDSKAKNMCDADVSVGTDSHKGQWCSQAGIKMGGIKMYLIYSEQGARQLDDMTEASVFQRGLKRREETDTALLIIKPDWRKEEFQAVNVTLDEATAHPSLLLTEEGRGVTLQEIQQDLPSSTQRFVSIPCVLGQPQICSGRYYWEVKVGELHSWDLGVCRDNVSRKGTFQMSPQNGFWAIRLYQEDYWALTISETHLTLREKPLSVGIFLDYEAGDVSFYNMTDESHIFTFSKQTFYGVLRPLFRLWFPDSGPLTIVEVE